MAGVLDEEDSGMTNYVYIFDARENTRIIYRLMPKVDLRPSFGLHGG